MKPREVFSQLDFVKVWRIFLVLAVISTLLVIVYEEVKTTVTYRYLPGKNNRFITLLGGEGNKAPVIVNEGDKSLLLNQETTTFQTTLTDIFDSLTIRAYYQAPKPGGIKITTERSASPSVIDSEEITVYDRLQEREWWKTEGILPNYPEMDLYANPGMWEYFPLFKEFLEGMSVEEIVECMYERKTVFVVKADKNTQHQSIADQHDLTLIQYVLLPESLEWYDLQFAEKVSSGRWQGSYVLKLEEDLHEESRERGAEFKFRLVVDDHDSRGQIELNGIELEATRQPVKLKNFFR